MDQYYRTIYHLPNETERMAAITIETKRGSSESSDFYEMVALALERLKKQLQHDCERAYPELRDAVPFILDREEKRAWDLSSFPHLLLPGLFEVQIAKLSVQLNLRGEEPTNASSNRSVRRANSRTEGQARKSVRALIRQKNRRGMGLWEFQSAADDQLGFVMQQIGPIHVRQSCPTNRGK